MSPSFTNYPSNLIMLCIFNVSYDLFHDGRNLNWCLFVYSSTTLSRVTNLMISTNENKNIQMEGWLDTLISWLIEPNSQKYYLNYATRVAFLRVILVLWILCVSCLSKWNRLNGRSLYNFWMTIRHSETDNLFPFEVFPV
mgnify:CR=1 FL=1